MASVLPQRITYYKITVTGEVSHETHDLIIAEYEQPLDLDGDGMGYDYKNHNPEDIADYYTRVGIDLKVASSFLAGKRYEGVNLDTYFPAVAWQQYYDLVDRGHTWTGDDYYFYNDTENDYYIKLMVVSNQSNPKQNIVYESKNSGGMSSGAFIGGINDYGPLMVLAGCKDGNDYRFLTAATIARDFNHYYMLQNIGSFVGSVLKYIHDNELEDEYEFDPYEGVDPYEPGGDNEKQGGNGTFYDDHDVIGVPSLPSISAVDTGLVQIFVPELADVKSLANVLWSQNYIDRFKKAFQNPMDIIMGFGILPITPNKTSGKVPIVAGGYDMNVSTYKATSQWYEVDCGTINVIEYFGAFLDYDPFTLLYLYLPFIGIKPLKVDYYMDKTLQVVYHIDILSGACVAYVLGSGSVVASWSGNCLTQIPVTSQQFPNIVSATIGVAVGAATVLGAGAALASGAGVGAGLAGMIGGTGTDAAAFVGMHTASQAATGVAGAGSMLSSAANLTSKRAVEYSGAMGSTAGLLSRQKPYLIMERPLQAVPGNQNRYQGYPSFITRRLGDLSGYTQVYAIRLNDIPATDYELQEIETLLYQGVII